MNVYVFGNEHVAEDKRAIEVAGELQNIVEGVSFIFLGPNEDVPFADEPRVVILDTVQGIRDVALVEGADFDLAFKLRYLKKLGKLGEVTVIGIPHEGEVDHLRIQSILRKLVAQDMQGS
jgi:hypothetical protein